MRVETSSLMVGLLKYIHPVNPIPLSRLTTHPLRDVWLLQKGNWIQAQEAVAWEELSCRTYQPPTGVDAVMLVYRRSGADYRRHAEAEAMLHLETLGIRDSGGYQFERRDPVASNKDYGLIMAAPHSVQPVVLEDNQATIRILESGKSPAFRHADKTQRINLGWISEQFRRKHYALAYVSTTLQAADILTKPFTSADKWNKALNLLSIRRAEQPTRKASAAPTAGACRSTRPEAQFSRLMIEICCGPTSILGEVAKEKYPECEVLRITKNEDLNNTDTRKSILSKAKSYAAVSKPILVWASLPCAGGSTWSHLNLTIEGNREKVLAARKLFTKLWASFVDLSCGLDRIELNMLLNGLRTVSTGHGIEYANGLNPTSYPKSLLTGVDLASKIRMALLSRNRGESLHHAKPS